MKTALITGGSRGIGKALVEKFLNEGYMVISTSTSGSFDYSNENLITKRLELEAHYQVVTFAEWAGKEGAKVDVLINNAAVAIDKDAEIVNIALLRRTLNVNLMGTIQLTEELLLREVMKDDSIIVNISSGFGSITEDMGSEWPAYSISKAAINKYTRLLASRLEDRNIRVYSFDPGWVKTDMGGDNAPRDPKEPAAEIFELVKSKSESGYFYLGTKKRDW
ncbi:MAG: SDR family NAD(P)-dependent oxidoreductase [Candidatus Dojkabacteria bacterium]|nr:MAG: SDR family NAD(P)-dependent oxidoreductase [Candidatus Dojkabacteria bacterium]